MSRRWGYAQVVQSGVVFLAALQAGPVRGQEREPIPSLRADAPLVRKLAAAREYLKAESWSEAIPLLQGLLDGPEDALVNATRTGKDGKEVACWTGLRAEATRLLGTLPPRGREFYDVRYGGRARALLAEARQTGDLRLLAEVARRYPHTAAGADAAGLLGVHHLDRGRHTRAALYFRRLLDRPDADALSPAVLFHAALAFRRAGDEARAEQAWKRLAGKARGVLPLRGKAVSLADLEQELARAAPSPAPGLESAPNLKGWPGVESSSKTSQKAGSLSRSWWAELLSGSPRPLWTRATAHEAVTRSWLRSAVRQQEDRGLPVLPALYPVRAAGLVIYRSHRGVHAVDLRTGQQAWEARSGWSIDRMVPQPNYAPYLESWVNSYLDVSPHVLLENAVLGTLSTDGARVYAVDDLAVPAYRQSYRFRGRWRQEPDWPDFGPELTNAIYYNRLLALDAASGKPVWEVGGRDGDAKAGGLSDSYFLGPPLPLDEHLYGVVERNNELTLVCLGADHGVVVWKQALAFAPTRLLLDPGRHIHAARPAYGDGVLVCPTNAGVVVGVDLLTPGLAWAYPYRGGVLTQSRAYEGRRGRVSPPRVTAEWKAPVTVVEQGRVVFTAADEPSVHCLRLRDGTPLWRAERTTDDVYVAGVVAGRVLLVGKQACRALDLADGKQLWQLETGLPSGRGVAVGGVYYLPVKAAGKEKEPAVYAIDVARGVVVTRARPPGKEAPGNLLFGARGEVVSQTATAVTAYAGKDGAD